MNSPKLFVNRLQYLKRETFVLGSFEKLVPYCTKGIKLSPAPVADPGFANGGPRSSAVGTRGARIEAPKAPRKVWCSEGVPPPHWGRVWGGTMPPRHIF